jgi:uncharacterized protein
MINRDLQAVLEKWMNEKEVIILYGPRQSGKTTLLGMLLNDNPDALLLNCERPDVADILESKNLARIKLIFGNKKIIALDEAQKIRDIGPLLKLIYDDASFAQKIIATGSSSFELSDRIVEPLTGRNVKFLLLPLSLNELSASNGWLWATENLESLLVFGNYPGLIYDPVDIRTKKLYELTSDYLFRDILIYENLRNSSLLRKLLKALALQVGSQVSHHELAGLLGVSSPTIEKYLDLLEKSFIIFPLPSFSRNLRNEIKKSKKYFFYDLGIRNALITNFSGLDTRTDSGAIWENFCILERLKHNMIHRPYARLYFWRTYDGAEIDLVEENEGRISLFEFKWKRKFKTRFPRSFEEKYPIQIKKVITRENINELLDY